MDQVGYMGVAGSFSEIAAEELLKQAGMEAELVPLVCAKNILEARSFIKRILRVCIIISAILHDMPEIHK